MVRLSLLILFPFHFNEWPFHRPEGVENEKCHYFHLKKKKENLFELTLNKSKSQH